MCGLGGKGCLSVCPVGCEHGHSGQAWHGVVGAEMPHKTLLPPFPVVLWACLMALRINPLRTRDPFLCCSNPRELWQFLTFEDQHCSKIPLPPPRRGSGFPVPSTAGLSLMACLLWPEDVSRNDMCHFQTEALSMNAQCPPLCVPAYIPDKGSFVSWVPE